jgi:glycosyltransferase involved in cell wall biosynthesis
MALGHEVVVVTRSATKIPMGSDYLFFNELEKEIRIDGIPVRFIRFHEKWRPLLWIILKLHARPAFSALAAGLYRVVASRPSKETFAGFDIIHHVGHATALFGFASTAAAKVNNTPILVQPTAHPYHFGDSELDFVLYRSADRLIVHTFYEREFFISSGINCPVDVVGNGIEDRSDGNAERFCEKYGIEGQIILYLGRKALDKGYLLIVEAMRLLRPRYPNAILVCMGPSSMDCEVQEGTGILDLKFVNEDDKHDALAACTLLCVPSEGESFGLVFMEAGLYRKPVIARKIPVLKELLGDDAALLLGEADYSTNTVKLSPDQLARGMAKLMDGDSSFRNLGDHLYAIARKFVWNKIVRNFEQSYYKAMTQKNL